MKSSPRSSRVPAPRSRTPSPARKSGRSPGTVKKSLKADPPATLPSVRLSPRFIQDSINSLGNLRKLTKQALQYVQQADTMIETLFSTANSLNESGILQKLIQHRGRNLSTADLAAILGALLNSPIGNRLFERIGGDGQAPPPSEGS
ncbi:MAG: hypothetical protein IMX06_05830 [Kyrpidia tusciae]|nr:hypothetical protein [Kyrpidia tusciae]MBE3552363.1 hypothetical protein [Kyrpidia tusciae]